MGVTKLEFALAEDGGQDKGFLSGAFIEREDSDTITFGVAHRKGGGYAFARMPIDQFLTAVQLLCDQE